MSAESKRTTTNHNCISVKSDIIGGVRYRYSRRGEIHYVLSSRIRSSSRDWWVCEISINVGRVFVYVNTILSNGKRSGKQVYRSFPLEECIIEYQLEVPE